MTEAIRVEVTYGRSEYIRAVRTYMRRKGIVSWCDFIIVPVLVAVMGGLIWLNGMTLMNTALVVLFVLVLGTGCFVYGIQPGRVFDRNPQLRQAVTYTFTAEDIGVRSEEVMGTAPWCFVRLWSTEEFYFLLEKKQHYVILPKRIFSGAEQMAQFEQMVLEANPGIRFREYR